MSNVKAYFPDDYMITMEAEDGTSVSGNNYFALHSDHLAAMEEKDREIERLRGIISSVHEVLPAIKVSELETNSRNLHFALIELTRNPK